MGPLFGRSTSYPSLTLGGCLLVVITTNSLLLTLSIMVLTDCETVVTEANALILMIGYLHQHAGPDDICLKAMNILGKYCH